MNRIPAWGLYRLLKAVRARGDNQRLDLSVPGGRISFGILGGMPYYVDTDIMHMGFGAFLARTRAVADDAVADIEAAARERKGSPCTYLIDSGDVSAEQAHRFVESHVRAVLASTLPVQVDGWSLTDEEPCGRDCGCRGVEPLPELMRAVAAHPEPATLRPTVERFLAGGPFFLAKGGESSLTFAKAHIADAKVLYLVRQGRARDITPEILADDANMRIIFALTVAEALTRDAISGAAPRPAAEGNGVVVQELRDAVKEIQSKNHYELLQIPIEARPSEVGEAFVTAMRRYSRDAYDAMTDSEVADHLDAIHARLEQARLVLSDRQQRMAYNRSINATSPDLEARLSRMFDAMEVWSAGKALMEQNKPTEALLRFEEANRQDPDDPVYEVSLAGAIVSNSPDEEALERAGTILKRVLADHDKMVEAHVGMAQYHRLGTDLAKAREHVRRALVLDPDNVVARRLKEILNARSKPERLVFSKKSESIVERIKSRFKRKEH